MLTVIYGIVLIAGLIVAGLGLLGMSRSFSPGSQPQADVSGQVLRLVPLAVGIGAAVFGLAGLVLSRLTAVEPGPSVIYALGAGLLVGFTVQAILYYRVLQHTVAQPPAPDPSVGRLAQVVIAIPGNGIGQITYESEGQGWQIGASSATFEAIPAGSQVVIEQIVRRVALVRRA
jgi:hypothetical protein